MPTRFIYLNRWRDGVIIDHCCEHPQNPAEDSQIDSLSYFLRTRYGTGSGNGLFVVTAPVLSGSELVTNGGFASDTSNWTAVNAAILSSEAGGQSGNCLQVLENGTASPIAQQTVGGLTINQIYQFSLYVKKGTGTNFRARIVCNSVTYGPSEGAGRAAPAGWTQFKIVFKAGATTAIISLEAKVAASSGLTQLFDGISLQAVTNTPNNMIDFLDHADGYEYWAYVAAGSYNGLTLAAAIKVAMDAEGGTYAVSYDESTAKFTIAAAANFTLKWNTTLSGDYDISDLCGFLTAADDAGAITYTSDNRRIHYPKAYIDIDLLVPCEANFIGLLGHNLSSAAVITLYGADNTAFTTNLTTDVIAWASGSIYKFLSASRTKRYFRVSIEDPTNSSSYIQVSTISLAKYFEPARNFQVGGEEGPDDVSDLTTTDSRNLYGQEKPPLDGWSLPYAGLSDAEAVEVKALNHECGVHRALVVCFDSSAPNTNSYLVNLTEINKPVRNYVNNWSWTANFQEFV